MKTLILNADFTPFDIVGYRKAFVMVHFKDAAYTISEYAKVIKDSKDREYRIPAVIVLKEYINSSHKPAPYNKMNVYARDRLICQYCHTKVDVRNATIDHVIPRCKWKLPGSPTRFDNVVTACKACNTKKGDKLLKDAGMILTIKLKGMTRQQAFKNKLDCFSIPQEWKPYVIKK